MNKRKFVGLILAFATTSSLLVSTANAQSNNSQDRWVPGKSIFLWRSRSQRSLSFPKPKVDSSN